MARGEGPRVADAGSQTCGMTDRVGGTEGSPRGFRCFWEAWNSEALHGIALVHQGNLQI